MGIQKAQKGSKLEETLIEFTPILVSPQKENAAAARHRTTDPTEIDAMEDAELPGAGAGATSLATVGEAGVATASVDGDVFGDWTSTADKKQNSRADHY